MLDNTVAITAATVLIVSLFSWFILVPSLLFVLQCGYVLLNEVLTDEDID